MSNVIQTVVSGFSAYFERVGRARVRRELLQYSDSRLEDMGFSRKLLEAGIDAWPWRLGTQVGNTADRVAALEPKDYRQAVRELSAYSDAELAELGLNRANIPYAVRHGRPGIDDDDRHAA